MTGGPAAFDDQYTLDHKYTLESGRVYLTGVQALVRLPIMQRQRDRAAGLETAGFISGYRGSPLGTYDMALWQAQRFLEEQHVRFQPGVNEDLAATAVWAMPVLTPASARYGTTDQRSSKTPTTPIASASGSSR